MIKRIFLVFLAFPIYYWMRFEGVSLNTAMGAFWAYVVVVVGIILIDEVITIGIKGGKK